MSESNRKMPTPEERPDLYDHYDGLPDGRKSSVVLSPETRSKIAEAIRKAKADRKTSKKEPD